MRITKYTVSFCLILLALGLIGEYQYFRLDQFYTKYDSTTLYVQPMYDQEQMKADIIRAADQYDVELFTYTRTVEQSSHVRFDIYGTDQAQTLLEKYEQLLEDKTYRTLLLGSISFHFHTLSEIPNMDEVSHYYAVDNAQNFESFKVSLIDKYAGNFPQPGYGKYESVYIVSGIWGILLLTILLLSYYDVLFKKKESVIRYILGESPLVNYCKHVTIDTLSYALIFIIAKIISATFTLSNFYCNVSMIFFILLVIGNILLHLSLLKYDLRELFSNSKGASKKLLTWNYSTKIVASILTTLLISSNIAIVYESVQLYKQRSFFEERSDYYYITAKLPFIFDANGGFDDRTDKNMLLQTKLYKEYFDQSTPILLADSYELYNYKGVIANRNAIPYLSEQIQSISLSDLDSKYYFLIPAKLQGKTEEHYFEMMLQLFEGEEVHQAYQLLYYDEKVELVRINQLNLNYSEWVTDPIIFLNALEKKDLTIGTESRRVAFMQEVMYRINEDQLSKFIEENNLERSNLIYTNVYEHYLSKWYVSKQLMIVNLLFSLLVLLLQAFVMFTIIKLEYDVNAMELAIKKIMGYSRWERYKKLIVISLLSNFLGLGVAITLSFVLDSESALFVAIGGGCVLIIELSIISFLSSYFEKLNVQKILKGGAL